jgi:ABC-type sugar transport system ATPase subunit
MADLDSRADATKQTWRLLATGVSKSFGTVSALRHADFDLRPGEVMALVGENGAGKSTFVKILSGLYRRSSGTIEIDGSAVELGSAARSATAGIAVVQQELSVVGTLSVLENLRLGASISAARRISRPIARRTLERVGLEHVDLDASASSLTLAERQMLEIGRVILRQASIVLLDEPTAALSDDDIARVHAVVRRMVADGCSVIYITHRLGEVAELADRVTVFRDGESQPAVDVGSIDTAELIARMLGRPMERMFPPRTQPRPQLALTVENFFTRGLAMPVDLAARNGEIVGLAGQIGSGAQELLRGLSGTQPAAGTVRVEDKQVDLGSPRKALRSGVAYCSGDRKHDGFFAQRRVEENLTAPSLSRISPFGLIRHASERSLARRVARQVDLDPGRIRHRVLTLSGGNQQKVVLGKWIGAQPRVLLVDEPTRGVDVGARAEIYQTLRALASEGLTIVFASSEMHEVQGLADRVITFFRGRIVGVYAAEETHHADLIRDITHPKDDTA